MNKIDILIENRLKEKIKKQINSLSNKNYEEIINQLSLKYDKEKIIEVLNELNIKPEEKLNLPQLEKKELINLPKLEKKDNIKKHKKSFSLFKKKEKNKEDITSKYDKIFNDEKLNLPQLEKKDEIKKPKKSFSLFKKKEKTKEDITSKYDKIFNEEKKEKKIKKNFIKESPRLGIAIIMIILFVISLSYVLIVNQEQGRGTCPHVSINDIRKLSNVYYEERDSLSFIEYDEIIGSYFGKNNCMTINRRTITKLRNL